MHQNNKLKCKDHNMIGEGFQMNSNSETVLCSQCANIKISINFQQQKETDAHHYINMKKLKYQQYRQLIKENYIKKKKMAKFINFDAQETQQNAVYQELEQQKINEPFHQNPKQFYQEDDKLLGQAAQQLVKLNQVENFFIQSIQTHLVNPQLYNYFVSYRIKWQIKQAAIKEPQCKIGHYFVIYAYQEINQNVLKDGHYIIFNNAVVMDGYFSEGILVEGYIITDDRGKIEFHNELKSLKFNQFLRMPFFIPFTVEKVQDFINYDIEIQNQY